MKVYNQGGNKPKKSSNAIIWYVVLLVLTVAVIVTVIATNTGRNNGPVDPGPTTGTEVTDPVTTKPVTYSLPFGKYTVARNASLDSLVYMPAINMWKTHNGVDFLPGEDDGVRVMADGKVTSVGQTTLEGFVVTVDHGDGLVSYYKSLSGASVKEGDTVKSGDVIGKAGSMMTETDIGKHVHLEITQNGKLVDPLDYLDTDASK